MKRKMDNYFLDKMIQDIAERTARLNVYSAQDYNNKLISDEDMEVVEDVRHALDVVIKRLAVLQAQAEVIYEEDLIRAVCGETKNEDSMP